MNASPTTLRTAARLMLVAGLLAGCRSGIAQPAYGGGYAAAPGVLQVADLTGAYAQYAPAWPVAEQPDFYAPGIDPLTQGPVHEAFAAPIGADQRAGLVIPYQPPAPIAEVPPAERPMGYNMLWILGYWSWDADRQGFIWVSGLWRDVPPNMRWIAGYWTEVDGGFCWVQGFWAPAAGTELAYLPPPPGLPAELPTPQPSLDSIWIPGYWSYGSGRYLWQPGFWMIGRADWDWIPPHYVWTPRGVIFVSGYWDHPIERRGMLFAPVSFAPAVYQAPQFAYSPSIAIDLDALLTNLFVQPRQNHYLFGDYYDPGCVQKGIYPLVDYSRQPGRFDPIYAHQRWDHRRDDPQWDEHQVRFYQQRRDDASIRPPRTFAAQEIERKRNPLLAQANAVLAAQTAVSRPDPRQTDTRAVTMPRGIAQPLTAREPNITARSANANGAKTAPLSRTAPAPKTSLSFNPSAGTAGPTGGYAGVAGRPAVTSRSGTAVSRPNMIATPNAVAPSLPGRTTAGRAATVKAVEPKALPAAKSAGRPESAGLSARVTNNAATLRLTPTAGKSPTPPAAPRIGDAVKSVPAPVARVASPISARPQTGRTTVGAAAQQRIDAKDRPGADPKDEDRSKRNNKRGG